MLLQTMNSILGNVAGDECRTNHWHLSNLLSIDEQTGFIRHRHGFSLQYKCLRSANEDKQAHENKSGIGLLFQSDKYLKPGTTIEVVISVHDKPEKICGRVVLVRDRGNDYDIGLWLGHHNTKLTPVPPSPQ